MLDSYNRQINYLRISVIDRCNQNCYYCMPEGHVNFVKRQHILSFEEIYQIVKEAVKLGIDKVRLTGGEPLIRNNILELVKMLADLEGIKDLSMTTNGVLLKDFAIPLKKAGLNRINISLDTVNREKYKSITRFDNLENVLNGIYAAKEAGLSPIKINCVVTENSKEKDAREVTEFAGKNGLYPRFIKMMNMENGNFWPVEGGEGGRCYKCNRLRLSSDGKFFPCLFSNMSFSVKDFGVQKAIKEAVNNKPISGHSAQHHFNFLGG